MEMAAQADNPPDPADFFYGRRQRIRYDKTGQPSYTYLPLTPDDFLNPQPGDEFAHGALHDQDVRLAYDLLRHLHRHNPFMTVLSNVKIKWPGDSLAQPAPDLIVISNMVDPDQPRPLFDVQVESAQPVFVLEIVSPHFAQADLVNKVSIYQQAGVAEYVIIDAGLRSTHASSNGYTVVGYRLAGDVYQPIEPDERGWIYSEINRAWIGVNEQRSGFMVVDARTGE
ncbi:MAG: Uma2 family endonuclease, partial [Chloroflexota bacterium]|nr:Uma2 family endonuclease [Chloroflexota bacterium]